MYNILVSAEDTNTTTTHLKINNNSVKTSVTATENCFRIKILCNYV